MSPYITSYYHNIDSEVTSSYLIQISLISYISETSFVLLLPILMFNIPAVYILLIVSVISCIGIFLSSYILSPLLFAWTFATILGFLSAFTFMPAVWIAIDAMPQNKGSVMGIGLCGYSMAPSLYGLIFTLMINPQNSSPIGTPKYFTSELTQNVPRTIRYLAGIILAIGILGSLLMIKNKKTSIHSTGTHKLSISQVLCHGKFWYLFAFLFTKAGMFYYLTNVYKDIAFLFIDDDYFIATIGSVGFIAAGLGRAFAGKIFDLFPWKNLILVLSSIEIVIVLLLYYAAPYRYLYGILVVMCLFIGSSSYLMTWMQAEKAYPEDKWVFSVINIATLFDLLVAFLIETFISSQLGYEWSLIFVAGILLLSVVLIVVYFDKYITAKPGQLLE